MKRNILKAWGIVLTAGMLIGGNGSGIVQAAEVQDSQGEVNTYQSESASTEEGTESGAEASGEEGGMAASGENEANASGEESKAPAETADPTESEAPAETVRPGESSAPVETVKPSESEAPVETVRPSESKAPVETVKPSEGQAPEETAKPSSKPGTPEETARPSSKPSTPEETAKPSSKPGTPEETARPSSKPSTPEETAKPSSKPSVPEGTAKPGDVVGETKTPDGAPAASAKPEEGSQEVVNGWKEEDGKYYWYVDGVKQGTEEADEEIYDPEAEAWYLLDSTDNGARVTDKAVYLETDGGKWVCYDVDGKRVQGEYSVEGQEYYYEPFTGAMVKGPMVLSDGRKVFYDLETGQMVKGECEINEVAYHFDEKDGHLIEEAEPEFWLDMEEGSYWYKDWVRQGWKPEDPEYMGEEVYDAVSEEWCWLDGTEQGRLAVNKLVYLENSQADKEGNLGKWVFYDENGHMFKGWTEDGMYYYDPIYGTMARGTVIIGNKQYEFDNETGLKLSEQVISGFEMYGLECNAEAGVEYDYVTACYDVQRLRTVGKTVFDYKTFESDESHPAKDGYEWKQVTVSMTYSDISAQYFGYQYAVLFGLDYYTFSNTAVETYESNAALDQGNVIEFEGKTYDISAHYEVLADGWNEDGVAQTVILYECQVPVGYDGMTIALYNVANIDKGETALERMDENSLIFRMQ